jgi:hypothetical protein
VPGGTHLRFACQWTHSGPDANLIDISYNPIEAIKEKDTHSNPKYHESTKANVHFCILSRRRKTPRRPPGGVGTLCAGRWADCAGLPTVWARPWTVWAGAIIVNGDVLPGHAGRSNMLMLGYAGDTERPPTLAETWNLHVHSGQSPRHHEGRVQARTTRLN